MFEILLGMNRAVLIWLIFVIVFLAIEVFTVTLSSIWFAAGSFAGLMVAVFNGSVALQIIVALIVTFGLLYLTKPWSKKFLDGKKENTNADRAIGQETRVIERINNLDQTGRVFVHGMEWTARTEDDTITIEQGELVRVIRIEGVKLIVERVEEV